MKIVAVHLIGSNEIVRITEEYAKKIASLVNSGKNPMVRIGDIWIRCSQIAYMKAYIGDQRDLTSQKMGARTPLNAKDAELCQLKSKSAPNPQFLSAGASFMDSDTKNGDIYGI